MLAVAVVLLVLVAVGWRQPAQAPAGIAPLPPIPADTANPTGYYEGMYVVTTTAGDWLDRVAVHGLGVRTKAALRTYPHGVLIDAARLHRPLHSGRKHLRCAHRERHGGQVRGIRRARRDHWKLGERDVDTAFRTRHAADKQPLLAQPQHTYPPYRKTRKHRERRNNLRNRTGAAGARGRPDLPRPPPTAPREPHSARRSSPPG